MSRRRRFVVIGSLSGAPHFGTGQRVAPSQFDKTGGRSKILPSSNDVCASCTDWMNRLVHLRGRENESGQAICMLYSVGTQQ
jgi:hypothetical protein